MDTDVARALKILERAGRSLGFLSALDKETLMILSGKAIGQMLSNLEVEIICSGDATTIQHLKDMKLHNSESRVFSNSNIASDLDLFQVSEFTNRENKEDLIKYTALNKWGYKSVQIAEYLKNPANYVDPNEWVDITADGKYKYYRKYSAATDKLVLIFSINHDSLYCRLVVIKQKTAEELSKEARIKKIKEDKEKALLADLIKKYPDAVKK